MRFHDLTIAEVRQETPDAVSIALTVPPALRDSFRFTPGQYLTVQHGEARRSYSICAGLDEAALRIGVKAIPGGAVSPWLAQRRRGEALRVASPEGRFGLMPDARRARNVLGIAAGSGITPVLSILRSVLAAEAQSRAVLLYGNRSSAEMMFREALDDLKDRYLDRLSVVHVLSREGQELSMLHGRLDAQRIAALLPGLLQPETLDGAFLCGPDGLAEAATEALTGLGVAAERIHSERFTPSSGAVRAAPPVAADAAAVATLTITAEGLTRSVPVASGETLLEAGLRAGLDLPWSCRGGMCCTCRAKLTAGEAAMDHNYSLTAAEQQAGFVLSCQARPLTPLLALDYDAA